MKLSEAITKKEIKKFDPKALKARKKRIVPKSIILDGFSDEYTISSFPGLINKDKINIRCRINSKDQWFRSALWLYLENPTVIKIMASSTAKESRKFDIILAIQELVDMGADVTIANEKGMTLLSWAAMNYMIDLFPLLKSYGFELSSLSDTVLKDLIFEAISEENQNLLQEIIDVKPYIINSISLNGKTALHNSVIYEYFEGFKILLKANANPFLLGADGFDKILKSCIKSDLSDYLDELIKYYPLFAGNYTNIKGETILMYAAKIGAPNCADVLINCEVQIDSQDKKGYTALMHAIENFNLQTAMILIENGANLLLENSIGESALMILLKHSKKEILESLRKAPERKLGFYISNYKDIIDIMLNKAPSLLDQTNHIGENIAFYIRTRNHPFQIEDDFLLPEADLMLPELEEHEFEKAFSDMPQLFLSDSKAQALMHTDLVPKLSAGKQKNLKRKTMETASENEGLDLARGSL